MNNIEKEMVDILKKRRDSNGLVAIKAEFGDEGTRFNELLRLLDIGNYADVEVTLKVGGCEACRDLLDAKQLGLNNIVVPMIETPYALKKFIEKKNNIYHDFHHKNIRFFFNLETITGFNNLKDIIDVSSQADGCDGLVFGRLDFVKSMGLNRDLIDTDEINFYAEEIASECKKANLDLVIGGSISHSSIPLLKKIKSIKLDRFETRKIIFNSEFLDNSSQDEALSDALNFEILWLLNKREYYQSIYTEDDDRIKLLKKRINFTGTYSL